MHGRERERQRKILTEGNEVNEGINMSSFRGLVPPPARNCGKKSCARLLPITLDWSRQVPFLGKVIGSYRE